MRIVVFLGPSLPIKTAKSELDCAYWAPAQRGDILRALNRGAKIIGLVDGYFRTAPSVLHKEILWALHCGCRVYGAASMGALRAAELHSFGMRGVGRIFSDYAGGAIERDDEVAVEHGPAELGYAATTIPLVNIRYTLERAVGAGVLAKDIAAEFFATATDTFYSRRSAVVLVEAFMRRYSPAPHTVAAVEAVLSQVVDQKALDTLELLRTMRAEALAPDDFRSDFRFEDTLFFSEIRAALNNPILASR